MADVVVVAHSRVGVSVAGSAESVGARAMGVRRQSPCAVRGQHVPVAVGRVGRRDGATSVAQAVPGITVLVLREREVP